MMMVTLRSTDNRVLAFGARRIEIQACGVVCFNEDPEQWANIQGLHGPIDISEALAEKLGTPGPWSSLEIQ